MVDNQGRIKGRVSIIDILIVLAIIGLIAGIAYRRATPHLAEILRPDEEFVIVFEVNRIRSIIAHDTVQVGHMLFRQHERQALGRIIDVEHLPAEDIMQRSDGTVIVAGMEGRYSLRITVEATGSVTGAGYLINGNTHLAPGTDIVLINSRVVFPIARVNSITHIERSDYE